MIFNKQKAPIIIGIAAISSLIMYIFPTIFYLVSFISYSAFLVFLVTKFINNSPKIREINKKVNEKSSNQAEIASSPKKIVTHHPPLNLTNDELSGGQQQVEISAIFDESCLDEDLLQTLDVCLHDIFKSWINKLIFDDQEICHQLRQDFWFSLSKMTSRLRNINLEKLVTSDFIDILNNHLERVSSRVCEDNRNIFDSDEKEMSHLKKLSDILIILLFPREYCLSPMRCILSEIISYNFLYSNISVISDPDFINQKIIDFIKHWSVAEKPSENEGCLLSLSRTVDRATNIDDLLKIRTTLLNDLFQALSISQQESNNEMFPKTKTNCIAFKEYTRILSTVKFNCEEKLENLGLPDLSKYNLTLKDILSTVIGRKYFTTYLKSAEAKSLVALHNQITNSSVYIADERKNIEILHIYLMNLKEFNFENDICNHDSLLDIQKKICDILEEKYYHPFVVNSKEYEKLSNLLELTMTDSQHSASIYQDTPTIDLIKLYVNARNNLGELREAINLEEKVYEVLSELPEVDLSSLRITIESLISAEELSEKNLAKIESWLSNLDEMKILSVLSDGNEIFEISLGADQKSIDNNKDHVQIISENHLTTYKTLNNIRQFNEELKITIKKLKDSKLFPSEFLDLLFNQGDSSMDLNADLFLGQLKEYFNFILNDNKLGGSEVVFKFFNSNDKKPTENDEMSPSPSDSNLCHLNDSNRSIADMNHIIEKGLSLVMNKDVIGKYFDEKTLKEKYIFSCLSNVLRSSWKETSESKTGTVRNDDMKGVTGKLAKDLILEKIPTLLNIFEYQRPKKGLLKLFNIFQNLHHNKQLIYDLLEVLLMEMFPEMKKIQQTMAKT